MQTLRDGLDRLLMRSIEQVGVDHGRGRYRAVPERLADVIDRRARVVGERRKCVPQSVQRELGQVVFVDKCAERFGQIVWQIGFAVRPGQHIAGVMIVRAVKQPVFALLFAFGAQHADDLVRHVQQTGRGTVFGVLFDNLRPGHRAGAVDAQRFALKINILPAQAAHFLAAQAEIAREIDDRLQTGALDGIQQPEQGFDVVKCGSGRLNLGGSTRSVGLRASTSCMTAIRNALRSRSWCLRAVLGDRPQSLHR